MKYHAFLRVSLIVLLFSTPSFALDPVQIQVDQKVPHGNGQLGVGSHLTMKIPGENGKDSKSVSGVFLGKVIDPNGALEKYMLLDETDSKVYFVDKANVEIGKYSFQPVLKPYDQVGGTCTGYAIDHFFQQMYWSGDEGTGELKIELGTEKGRTQMLVDSINEYYLVLQHRFSLIGVMNKIGTRFGIKCKTKSFTDSESAIQFLQVELKLGLPVMISFNIGPNMATAPFPISTYGDKKELDSRLWIPRARGQRNSGGHTVVAASYFETNGRPMLLMVDSDWAEPRVWDVKNNFNTKTAIEEVEFLTCQ